jgi:hypothetical protein
MSDPIPTESGPDLGVLAEDALATVTGGLPASLNGQGNRGFIIDGCRQALGGPATKALGSPDTSG